MGAIIKVSPEDGNGEGLASPSIHRWTVVNHKIGAFSFSQSNSSFLFLLCSLRLLTPVLRGNKENVEEGNKQGLIRN